MAAVMALAAKLCKEDEQEEEKQHGELLPCRKLSPLSPYLKLEEYHMLERDKGKYLLYMAAINQAVSDIIDREETSDARSELLVKCLVLGPGLGRLIKFCIDAAHHQGTSVMVHALEANPVAVEFLNKEFANSLGKEVFIYDPFVFHPSVTRDALPEGIKTHCQTFDMVVSELLGCFGDDEVLPELTSSLAKLFLRPNLGIMIPQSWTNYIVPVSSCMTHDFLRRLKRPSDAGYVMGLPADCMFLSSTTAVWSGDCCELADDYSAEVEFDISLSYSQLLNSKAKENSGTGICMCWQKFKGGRVASDGSSDTDNNETKSIYCLKAQDSKQSFFTQFTCNIENKNIEQDTLTPIMQGKQLSAQDQPIPPQNIASLGHTDICLEQTPSLEYRRPVQIENQAQHATLHTSLSGRGATNDYGEGKTADTAIFDCKPKVGCCKCYCHLQSTHKQKVLDNMSRTKDSEVFVHGFIGYFTASLYGDIMIDTRHTSLGRNSFHWECFFFPLQEPIKLLASPSDSSLLTCSVRFHLERKCKQLSELDHSMKLWYEWQATVIDCFCDLCVFQRDSRIEDKTVSSGGCDKMVNELKQFNDDEKPTAVDGRCYPATTQSSVERIKHKYPLQNAEGRCDAVFLQFPKPSKTPFDNTVDDDSLSFQPKPKKQKQFNSNSMSEKQY